MRVSRSVSRQLYWYGYRYVMRASGSYGMAEAVVRQVERTRCPGEFKAGARRALGELAPVPGAI